MPPFKDVSTFFLKDVMTGKKKVSQVFQSLFFQFVKNDAVKIAQVPHYEGLHLEDLMEDVAGVSEMLQYFPEPNDWFN